MNQLERHGALMILAFALDHEDEHAKKRLAQFSRAERIKLQQVLMDLCYWISEINSQALVDRVAEKKEKP